MRQFLCGMKISSTDTVNEKRAPFCLLATRLLHVDFPRSASSFHRGDAPPSGGGGGSQ